MSKELRYSELIQYSTFEGRLKYLRLNGLVGFDTFGFDRYLNQKFYTSREWKMVRNEVILRDNACDLGLEGYDLHGRILIHHLNPLRKEDIMESTDYLLNPEYLICVSHDTHNRIHYGNDDRYEPQIIERTKNDTIPWRNNNG